MAAAAGPRCLSDLPDELLERILFFVPGKEAASTAVLSRRWRSLWRASGALYLDSRYLVKEQELERKRKRSRVPPHRVEEALAAAAAPIKRLTLVVKEHSRLMRSRLPEDDLVGAVISSPAARHVEELHVEVVQDDCSRPSLSFHSLSWSRLLRVLRIVGFSLVTAPAFFPPLVELHLQNCTISLADLQTAIDAAPQLDALHIESSYYLAVTETEGHYLSWEREPRSYRLICPAVTTLVVADPRYQWGQLSLEVDAPKLKYFRYKGAIQICNQLLLKSLTPSNMIQVELHLIDDGEQVSLRSSFWQFVQNFGTAKLLKLELDFSMDMVSPYELSTTLFHRLERLELDAHFNPTGEASMSALASLLHCCPVVRDLRLRLRIMSYPCFSIDKVARADFDKSVDHFRHRHRSSMRSLDGEGGESYEDSCNIPVLSEQSFRCLESCLRRVSLHFRMDEPNCLGVKLAKFFAEKTVVLEDLHIDDGSHKMLEHINVCVPYKTGLLIQPKREAWQASRF